MKIDHHQLLSRTTQPEQGRPNGRVTSDTAGGTGKAGPAVVTHLSPAIQDTSRDIDMTRVNELRQAISEGRLEIRADKIADGLLNSVRDLLEQQGR
ncbi:flagellar biosynthesis anti-sigma factor FlgM [Zobellella maritima]|uniref:flagellar biosynthesis anti-sigma factor FlgM n=1 Tax=Zobellella maritima TaxID=2059725 RepID=UPI000E304796|nr:flagellar biosynthesis anti-sigma factor FlgM [Zobellella maritima]